MANLRGPRRRPLSIKEAAEYMGLSVRQMRRLIDKRAIKYWKTTDSVQGHIRIDPDVLDEYQEKHRVEALR